MPDLEPQSSRPNAPTMNRISTSDPEMRFLHPDSDVGNPDSVGKDVDPACLERSEGEGVPDPEALMPYPQSLIRTRHSPLATVFSSLFPATPYALNFPQPLSIQAFPDSPGRGYRLDSKSSAFNGLETGEAIFR